MVASTLSENGVEGVEAIDLEQACGRDSREGDLEEHPRQGLLEKHRNNSNQRENSNRVRALWILMFAVAIGTVVAVSFILVRDGDVTSQSEKSDKRDFSFDDIFDLTAQSFSVDWFDGKSYTYLQSNDDSSPSILQQEITEPISEPITLLDGEVLPSDLGTFSRFSTSFDQNRIMLPVNETKVWRHSFRADYVIFDVDAQSVVELMREANDVQQMGATWSPVDNKVAFVHSNDIYIRDVSTQNLETRVTSDGSEAIINGIHNWVYEEEIYGSDFVSMWWAPDGGRLAYIRSDESEVETFKFMEYDESPYPDTIDVKYPTAGTTNPTVSTGIYYVDEDCTQIIDLSVIAPDEELYITMVFWVDENTVALRILDRLHRDERIYFATLPAVCSETPLPADAMRLVRRQTDDRYLERSSALRMLSDGDSNLMLDLMQNEGYNHIAVTNVEDGSTRFITSGDFEVTSVAGYHAPSRAIFFYSTEMGPLERHLYGIDLDGQNKVRLTSSAGWWSGSFSPTAEFYLEVFGGNGDLLQVPRYTIRSTTGDFTPQIMENNAELRNELVTRQIPLKRYIQIPNPLDPNGDNLNAYVMFPENYDPDERYPILVDIYGGPGAQEVTHQFGLGFDVYLASSGFIIASVDCRGTGARGLEFKKQTYGNLGTLETEDFITFGRYLRQEFNPTSLTIWGWSYGGYMTSKVMQQDVDQVYDGGMIVAPVTSWYYYDTVYTERYMDTPQNNPEGYANTAVVGNIENFANKKFVIAHGTGDDNVHFHNAIVLYMQLIDAEIQFDSMIYPNEDHGIPSRRHLYRYLADWLFRNGQ